MSVPTHRPDCQTRIWQTRCLDCGRTVYYFSCSCGSKVFFDSKGDPWPLHADSCPVYNARLMIEAGVPPRQIRRLLDVHARNTGIEIPRELETYLSNQGAGGKRIIQYISPGEDFLSVIGRVNCINRINFYKRYG